jgi:hypothetical protein
LIVSDTWPQISRVDGLKSGHGAIDKRKSSMRSCLAVLVLVAATSQAGAQTSCSELTDLRREAAQVSRQGLGVPTSERCVAYNRVSAAWNAVVKYASDHREQCEISLISLNEFEKRHREASIARDNVCAGRPARPFPPEIIHR